MVQGLKTRLHYFRLRRREKFLLEQAQHAYELATHYAAQHDSLMKEVERVRRHKFAVAPVATLVK